MSEFSERFFQTWVRLLIRRPVAVIVICLTVAVAMGVAAVMTPADLSFTGMLDGEDPEVIAYREMINEFGADSTIMILLEGEAAALARVSDRLVAELPGVGSVSQVVAQADPEWILDRAAWFWPDELFDRVIKAVEENDAASSAKGGVAVADATIRHALKPTDKAILLSTALDSDPLDMAMGGRDFFEIQDATEEIVAEEGGEVTAGFAGIGAVGAQDQYEVFTRVRILTPLTLVLVLILLTGVESRLSRVAAAGIALGSSVMIAFGLVGLIQGRLSIISTFFGMLLLGLGIDFGIHLLVSLRDARAHGMDPEEALGHGLHHTAGAIVLGGVSTALAFGVVALAPEPGARDMGLTALFGMVAALILMLSFLPAAWLLLERRPHKRDTPTRFNLPGLHATVGFSLAHPWTVIAIGAALTIGSAIGIPRYSHETDLTKIISRKVPALEVEARLMEIYDFSPAVYLAPVESLDQAREWTERVRTLPEIARVSSAADFIRDDSADRARRMRDALGIEIKAGADARTLRGRLARSLELGAPTLDDLPAALRMGMIGKNGELALRIIPRENLLELNAMTAQINRLREIAPTTTGMPVIAGFILGRPDYVPILMPTIFVIVVIVLGFAFRDWRDVALGMLPVMIGTAVTFGAFFWLGLQFSLLTTIVVPVILGLGVDDGIHVVERLRRIGPRTEGNIHAAVEGVGRAIFLTTATTSVSFTGLLFSNHAGMESIGLFMLIGVPMCFVASVTVLPAVAKLLARGVKETDPPSEIPATPK